MAEPQPAGIHEGASTPPAPPAAASAAAEAAALSSLDSKTLDEPAAKKEIDLKALNDAMKALDSGSGSNGKRAAAPSSFTQQEAQKLVKVNAADVTLLAEQLDLSRPKATEFLRAHDADAVKAMRAWVTASV